MKKMFQIQNLKICRYHYCKQFYKIPIKNSFKDIIFITFISMYICKPHLRHYHSIDS